MKANSPTVLTAKEITCLKTNEMYIWFCSSFPQHMWLLNILSFLCTIFSYFFLFICPDSQLTAGFTYDDQLTDALQDIKHIYDRTPDKSLYVTYLSCKAGGGGAEKEKRPALGWCHSCWAHLPQIKLPSKGLISQTYFFSAWKET